MKNIFKGKQILVTGGVGSIGSELVKRLLAYQPASIRLFDNNEYKLFEVAQNNSDHKLRPLLGDIRDSERVTKAMQGVDIVFHAAALKHVELSEYNPFEVVKTNILGTQNVLTAALNHNVERVVIISTDKAVNPSSTMGATKLVAERLAVAALYHRGSRRTVFSAVRFGNVMGSNGSVIPTWIEQIKRGQPLTITDRQMTRFMMTIQDAVELVFKAAAQSASGEIFILKMPSLKVIDLASAVYTYFKGKEFSSGFQIREIGMKPGEKLHEELIAPHETLELHETDDHYVLLPKTSLLGIPYQAPRHEYRPVLDMTSYQSDYQQLLSTREILKMLIRAYPKRSL